MTLPSNLNKHVDLDNVVTAQAALISQNATAESSVITQNHINQTSGAHDSSVISFTKNGAGAVTTSIEASLLEEISVFDFMTSAQIADVQAGTATLDLTSAIQAAFNALPSRGGKIIYPAGVFRQDSAVTISTTGSVMVCGSGIQATHIILGTATQDGFVVTSSSPICFKDLWIDSLNATPKTAGAAVKLDTGASTINYRSHFDNCFFLYQYTCIDFERAAEWKISNCQFSLYQFAGLQVKNIPLYDAGDSGVNNSIFAGATKGNGIIQYSSGGLRIVNCKFNNGLRGYLLSEDITTATSETSVLVIVGNSFENMTGAGIDISRSGDDTFAHVVITGNEFALNSVGINVGTGSFLRNVNISGNVISIALAGGNGINLNSGTVFYIGGNTIYGNGGTTTGISVNSSVTNSIIGVNKYQSLTTNINNGSTSVAADNICISGLVSPVTNAAYGSLYSGTTTINIPTGIFTTAPKIHLTALGSGGGVIGGLVETSIPVSGSVTIRGIATSNAATVQLQYTLIGI